jgi:hypothetical protein
MCELLFHTICLPSWHDTVTVFIQFFIKWCLQLNANCWVGIVALSSSESCFISCQYGLNIQNLKDLPLSGTDVMGHAAAFFPVDRQKCWNYPIHGWLPEIISLHLIYMKILCLNSSFVHYCVEYFCVLKSVSLAIWMICTNGKLHVKFPAVSNNNIVDAWTCQMELPLDAGFWNDVW